MPYSFSPPGFGQHLEHRHVMTMQRQRVGTGQPRRPRPNDGDLPPGRFGAGERLDLPVEQPVRGIALKRSDGHRLVLLRRPDAGLLAQDLGRADAGAGAAHDVVFQDRDRRPLDVVGRDFPDEARDVDSRRACLHAGGVVAEIAARRLDQRLFPVQRRCGIVEIDLVLPWRKPSGSDISRHVHHARHPACSCSVCWYVWMDAIKKLTAWSTCFKNEEKWDGMLLR